MTNSQNNENYDLLPSLGQAIFNTKRKLISLSDEEFKQLNPIAQEIILRFREELVKDKQK